MTETGAALATERLDLAPFSDEHLPFLHEHWTDPEVRRYLWDDRSISRDEAADVVAGSVASFRDRGFGFWVLVERASSQPVGFAGLREFGDAGEIELLYGLSPARWGRGYATEASRAVLAHAFDTCRLPRVHAGTDPPNEASIRVIERLGMTFEGRRVIDGVEALYYFRERAPVGVPSTSSR